MKFSPSLVQALLAVLAAMPAANAQVSPTDLLTLLTTGNPNTLTPNQIQAYCQAFDNTGTLDQAGIEANIIGGLPVGTPVTGNLPILISNLAQFLLAECSLVVTTTTTTPVETSTAPTTTVVPPTTTSVVPSSSPPVSSSIPPVSSTTTSSTSSAASPSGSTAANFVVQVGGGVTKKLKNRQVATRGYIAGDGSIVGSCGTAARFVLTASGQLQGSGGGLVSTNGAVANALFVAVNPALAINTLWGGNPLSWTNSAFAGGAASFCQLNNQVYSVFQTAPAGCVTVTLTQVPIDACVDINNGGGNNNNTTINNTIYNGNVYQVNGSIYDNSFNGNGNGNVAVDGDNNNVNAGANNSINVGQMVNVKSVLPSKVWAKFQTGEINYYCSDDYYYYAKFCDTCEVCPVEKTPNPEQCYYYDTDGSTQCVPGYDVKHMDPAPPCSGYDSAQWGEVDYWPSYCVDKCKPAPPSPTTWVIPTYTCDYTTISDDCYITASSTPGQKMITTVICAECETSTIAIVPEPCATEGGAIECPSCPDSKTATITPCPPGPAETSPIPFTGAAAKSGMTSGAFLALFGLFFF